MHEIKIAEDLAKIVLEAGLNGGLTVVTRVNVSFGKMIQIVPEIFKFAFTEAVRGTIAGNTEIDIEILPVKTRCKKCGEEFLTEDGYFSCIKCNSSDLEITQGREMFVKSIEGE